MNDPRAFLEQCSIITEGLSDLEVERRAEQVLRAVERYLAQEASRAGLAVRRSIVSIAIFSSRAGLTMWPSSPYPEPSAAGA